MDHAYLFPFNVPADRANLSHATRVNLYTDYDELIQASHAKRLRCCYVACLERVKPVRRDESDNDDLRHFAHVEVAEGAVPCPYRVPHEGPETREERIRRREHNARKVIENDLRVALEDKLAARKIKAVVRGSEYSAPEPCITVTGFGTEFEIRGLAPGCEPLWGEPFDGMKDGKPVLFFVLEGEASRLRQPFVDEHLLKRRPAIVIRTGKDEWEEHKWIATSTLRRIRTAVHRLREVDLMSVDYRRLFGIDRAAETLFIPTSYREAIERITAQIQAGVWEQPEIAMLRSFAELLLEDGAGVRPALFGHEERIAPNLDVLLKSTAWDRFCGGDPALGPLVVRSFATTLNDVQRTLAESRDALAKKEADRAALAAQLDGTERQRRTAEARVTELETKLRVSREELARSQEAFTTAKTEREALQRKIDKVTADLTNANNALTKERTDRSQQRRHWLVQVDEYLHRH